MIYVNISENLFNDIYNLCNISVPINNQFHASQKLMITLNVITVPVIQFLA